MTRLRRWLRRILVTLVAFVVLCVVAWIFRWQLLGGTVRSALRDAGTDYGLSIEIEDLSGSLFGDVTVRGVSATPTATPHLVRSARAEHIHITFSLAGLLRGDDRWLGEIDVDGVRGVVDVRAPLPTPATSGSSGGTPIVPVTVRISDVDLTVHAGSNRLDVRGGSVEVTEVADRDWKGHTQAEHVRALLDDETDEFAGPRADVNFVGGRLTVVTGGQREVIRADLSRLKERHLEADLDLPVFGGGITGQVRTDLGADTMTANLRITGVRAAPLLRFLPEVPVAFNEVSGTIEATLAGASNPDLAGLSGTFRVELTEPKVDRWVAERVEVSGDIDRRILTVKGRTEGPGSEFDGRLWIEEEPRFEATVILEEFDLDFLATEIADRYVRGIATGRVGVSGTMKSPEFSADLQIADPGFGEWSADGVDVKGRGSASGLAVERFLATRGKDRVTVKGTASFGETVTLTAEGGLDVASAAEIVELCGVDYPAELDAGVRATFAAEPDADGGIRVLLSDVMVKSPLIIAEGTGIETRLPPLNAEFDPDRIAVDGRVAVRGVDTERLADRFDLKPYGSARASGELVARGTIGNLHATLILDAQNVRLRPPHRDEIQLTKLSILARHEGEGLVLEQLLANGGDWGLVAQGRLEWDPLVDRTDGIRSAVVSGMLTLVDAPLSITGAIPGLAEATGTLSAKLAFGGTVEKPTAVGTINITAPRIRPSDVRVPEVQDVRLALTLSDGGLDGVRVELGASSARVLGAYVSLESGAARLSFAPFRITAPSLVGRIRGIDARILGERLGAEELFDGALEVDLTVSDGPEVDLAVRSTDLRLSAGRDFGPEELPGALDLRAHWGRDGLQVKGGTFVTGDRTLRVDVQVSVSPSLDPPGVVRRDDEPLRVVVTGEDLDLAAYSRSLPRLRLRGRADVWAELDGTLGKPRSHATVVIRDGFARYPGAPPLDDIQGRLELTHERVVQVQELTALLGRGRLTVDPGGTVQLVRTGPGSFDLGRMNLKVTGQNALLARSRKMLIRATPDLEFSGGGDSPRFISGSLEITSIRYSERIDLASRRPALAPLPLTEDPFLASLNLDVRVSAPRESIRVRNNLLDAEFGGEIRLLGTVALPRPEGRIISDRGSVRLPTLTMKLVQGVAEFRRERPLQPYIDTILAANINRITVDVGAKGPIDNLEITTRSLPPLPEEDIISLLATGQVPEDVEEGTAATMAATLLYRQLLSEMDDSDPDDDPTTIEDLASRVEEISVDTATLLGGGSPTWRATLRLDGEWLYLRGDQTDSFNYGLDLLFRLSFR